MEYMKDLFDLYEMINNDPKYFCSTLEDKNLRTYLQSNFVKKMLMVILLIKKLQQNGKITTNEAYLIFKVN